MGKKKNQGIESNPLVDGEIQAIEVRSSLDTNILKDEDIMTIEKLSEEEKKNGKTVERLQKKREVIGLIEKSSQRV